MKHAFQNVLDERFVALSPRICVNCGVYVDPYAVEINLNQIRRGIRGEASPFQPKILDDYPDCDALLIEQVMES